MTGHTNRAESWEIGGKISYASAELVGYYYDGKNMGNLTGAGFGTGQLLGSWPTTGLGIQDQSVDHDVNGGYVQATYKLPIGTKLGLSWGESNVDKASGVVGGDFTDRSWVVGAYHPLTKSLNLVAEYTDTKLENVGYVSGANGKAKTAALGAILFF